MTGSPRNDRLIRALKREPVDCTPVWIMRQAGRYLPEYRASRERAGDFLTLCKTPELACEVTMQPLARFDLDAAILFSDILTIPDAMGLGLSLHEGEGPRFARPINSKADVDSLGVPDPEDDLGYVLEAVRVIRHELADRVPLIGFSGSPWTLATYMVEGRSTRDFAKIKNMIYREAPAAQKLLGLLSQSVGLYLKAQARAGAQVLMVFDTWGGVLGHAEYREFSLDPMAQVLSELQSDPIASKVPTIVFTKGGGQWLPQIASIGCDAIGCDWTTSLAQARLAVKDQVALQGNLDPAILYASPERIRSAVAEVLADFGSGPGHVFNLGHGVTPGVNPDHVKVLVDAVHELSIKSP
ncbi:uroporphyrinogen decarboxylase [Arenicellales bacterium IMCC57338]|jgi:uroporphyrinogen decarboxylase|nr:uroporphyrinogen decarboxylase [Arenicellales bacterium]MDC0979390.1 uroporphyrinogen decarboxylase [Gammaproteobacteria bacterium]MDC1097012.1 uroporphyrinogen decarboxylase [Gammaproteobacteria bacterium]